MAAQRFAEPVDRAGGFAEAGDEVGDCQFPHARVLHAQDVAPCGVMRVLEDFVDRVDRPARYLVGFAHLHQLGAVERRGPCGNRFIHRRAVALAVCQRPPAFGAGEIGPTHRLREPRKNLVVGAGDGDPTALFGGVMAVRHHVHRAGAHALAHQPGLLKGRCELVEDTENRLVQPDIDHLAAPGFLSGLHGQQGAHGAVDARHIVGNRRRSRRHRCSVGVTRQERQSTERVADTAEARAVLVGASLPVAGDADHDQPRVNRRQDVPAQPPFLQRARLKILDQHIGFPHQTLDQRSAVGLTQIQRDALLVPRFRQPWQGIPTIRHRAKPPRGVADTGEFDLDHLGAELAQLRRRERAGEERRDIEDATALQRLDVDHWMPPRAST